jgi:predicted nuclease of predicted toxin-antitoxin system
LRLFLDLQISGRAFGVPLRADGHDVLVGTEDPRHHGTPDADLLRIATRLGRIMVTFDIDYVPLAREWGYEGWEHAGILLVVGMRTNEYGPALRAIRAQLNTLPKQEQWRNILGVASRSSA